MSVKQLREAQSVDPLEFPKLFIIGGPQWEVADWKEKFSPFGEIKKLDVLPDKKTGKNKGICYITYAKTSEAALAIERMNGASTTKPGDHLKIMFSRNKTDKLDIDVEERDLLKRLFIKTNRSQSEEDIREYFGQYGAIKFAKVLKDSNTKESRGLGFIMFNLQSEAARALEENEEPYRPRWADIRRNDGSMLAPDACFSCGQSGHMKSDCPTPYSFNPQHGNQNRDGSGSNHNQFGGRDNQNHYGGGRDGQFGGGMDSQFGGGRDDQFGGGRNRPFGGGRDGQFGGGRDSQYGFNGNQSHYGGGNDMYGQGDPFGKVMGVGMGGGVGGGMGMGIMSRGMSGGMGGGEMGGAMSAANAIHANTDPMGIVNASLTGDVGPDNLEALLPENMTQEQAFHLFDIAPGLESCSLNKHNNIARVEYSSAKCASYAKGKIDGMDYSGEKIAVRFGKGLGGNSLKKTAAELQKTLQMLTAKGGADPMELMQIMTSITKVTEAIQNPGSDSFDADSGSEMVPWCSVALPIRKPLVSASRHIEARLFVVAIPDRFTDEILLNAFCRFGDLITVKFQPGKRFGFAHFAKREAAEQCKELLHGQYICNNRLKIEETQGPKLDQDDDGGRQGAKRGRMS